MNKEWKYLNYLLKSEDTKYLNELGKLGWEAYAVNTLPTGETVFYLKREK